jgi:hypothetical protein
MNGALVDGAKGSLDLAHAGGGAIGLGTDSDDCLARVVGLGGDIGGRVPIQSSIGLLMQWCAWRRQLDSVGQQRLRTDHDDDEGLWRPN